MGMKTNLNTGRTRLDLIYGWAIWDDWDRIVVGDRYLPARIEVTFPGGEESPQPSLTFVIEVINGVAQVSSVAFTRREGGRGVRPNDLDDVRRRLNDWIEEILAASMMEVVSNEDGKLVVVDRVGPAARRANTAATRGLVSGGRRKIDKAHLERVADTYRQNAEHAPVDAVAAAFDTSYRSAARWVQKAREAGLIEEKNA